MKRLSIIVPVYNVEKYVRTCVESIFRQGLSDDEFEVIIINDGTPDRSIEIISDIIAAHNNIRVINQQNQGVSITRNNGIKNANGEYIVFIDSDDLIFDNCLPLLLKEAQDKKVDMVMADFIEMNTNNINLKEITIPENLEIKEKSGEDLFLDDMSPWDCHVWHFLYRKDFLKERNISFIPNIIYEDIPFMHECFLKARRCLRIKYPMYIYRQGNTLSITSNFRKKSGMDLCFVLGELWKLTYQKDLSPRIVFKLKQNIYTSFSYLTYSVIHDISNNSERLEILKNIKHHAPEMYFRNGFRQKSVNFFIKRLPWAYLNFRVFYANHLEKRIWKIRKHIKRANTRTKIIQI